MRIFRQGRLAWIALFVLLLLSAAHDLVLLLRYPVAVGIDGYYYVLQINQLTKTGQFYSSTQTPIILYTLTAFSYLTRDAVLAIKVASVTCHFFLSLGVYVIIKSTVRSVWLALLGSALTVIPQSHLYMTAEFINNLGAVTLLVWSGWGVIRFVQTGRRLWAVVSIILLAAAFFSHRSATVISLTIALLVLFLRWLIMGAACKRLAFLTILFLWLTPALVALQPFLTIPAWLQKQVSARPHWPFEGPLIPEELMLVIASTAVLFLIIRPAPKATMSVFNYVFGPIALWSLIVTLNPFLNPEAVLSGLAGRLRVMSYIQVALLVPGLIWLVYSVRKEAGLYVGVVFLPLVMLTALASLPSGLQPEFLVRRAALIHALKLHANELVQNPIVIAPHGDQFLVTATISVPSQQRPLDNPEDRKVYWLLDAVNDQALADESIVLISKEDKATILVEDAVLKARLQSASDFQRRTLVRANPHFAKVFSSIQSGSMPK